MKQKTTQWEATKTPGLYVRRPGETFYARITLHGKRSWRSLETTKLREAQGLLRDLQSGHAKQVTTRNADALHAAMDKVIEARSARRALRSQPLKKKSAAYHDEILVAAKKLFSDKPLADFKGEEILNTLVKSHYSLSRRKALFELLRGVFRAAVQNGSLARDPLAGYKTQKAGKKQRSLPTREELEEIFRIIPELFPRWGKKAALSGRYLAFSGMRIDEARAVDWTDVIGTRIRITGGEEGTKTLDAGQYRWLDINPPLQAVLDDIAAVFGREGRVMPQLSILPMLKAACEKLELPVINHHDLRAWFITWGITSGVDVATLAGWVGNSPAVLLERYTAVQGELRATAAAKLS